MKTKRLGWIPDVPDARDRVFRSVAPGLSFPSNFTISTGLPNVFDQGELGSCTANASGAAFYYTKFIENLMPTTPSRLFIYYNARVLDGTTVFDGGASIRSAIKGLNNFGSCGELDCPYVPQTFAIKPSSVAYTNAALPGNMVIEYQRLPRSLQAFKHSLTQNIPVVIGFSVYESFYGDWVDTAPIPTLRDSMIGGHAVLVIGYDEARQALIIRNSWGKDWKVGGNFYLPYQYIQDENLSDDFWVILSTIQK